MSPNRAAPGRLSEHLDAVVSGEPGRPGGLDPATIETVARFFAADDAPPPPSGLADRIWSELSHQRQASPNGSRHTILPPSSEHASRTAPERPPKPLPQRSPSSHGRFLSLLAAAALVALTLVGTLVAVRGPQRLLGQEERPVNIPAISGAPNATTVMETLVTEWPAADPLLWATLRREILAPGAVEEFGVAGVTGDSLDLFIVESGQLTVEAEGPTFLWRAGDDPGGEPTALPAGSTIVLESGDHLFIPVGAPSWRRNDAGEPAVFMGFQMTQQEVLLHPAGVTSNRVEPDKVLNAPPQAPATLGLHRLRLLPGERLSLLALPGLQMLHVEEGTLDLMGARRLGDLAPESWKSVPAGQGMAHFDSTTALANGGIDPVTVLIVTIEPVG
jgi:mannose-6-phosphate isomerase-like protein (cupin superfamily)